MELIKLIIIFFVLNIIIYLFHPFLKKINFPVDKPDNERKFHKNQTLLSGGLIIFINFILLIYFVEFFNADIKFLKILIDSNGLKKTLLCFICLFLLGFLDDKYNINANIKFSLLILIVGTIIYNNDLLLINEIKISFLKTNIILNKLSLPFTILCLMLFINAFNMFDGINMQNALYTFYIIIFFLINKIFLNFSIIILIPLFLFMLLNHRNQSFLGDSGCYILSTILGLIFIISYNQNMIKFSDDIFILMILPGVDMFRLFIQRAFNKKNPFHPDRYHFHHILLKKVGYSKTVLLVNFINTMLLLFLILNINNIYSVAIFLLIYFYLIFFLKKFNNQIP